MGQQQGSAVVNVTTTAKSQAMALCCAAVVAKRFTFPRNPTRSAPCRTFVGSTALFRAWAEDWVLKSDRETVFRLPIEDSAHCWAETVEHFLYLSVSPTLGVVRHSWLTRNHTVTVIGCVGQGRLLVANREDFAWEVVDAVSGDKTGDVDRGAVVVSYGKDRVKCNRKWIVAFSGQNLNLWKVAGGAVEKRVCIGGVEFRGDFEFSPICDDVVVQLTVGKDGNLGVVTFIDLGASFKAQELVVASRVVCRQQWPSGVMWLPDDQGGGLCILHHAESAYYLLSANQDGGPAEEWRPFPPLRHVAPISKSHAIVTAYHHTTQFSVHRVGHDISEPILYLPCTWVHPCQSSGLIASTEFCKKKAESELPSTDASVVAERKRKISFAVHDGATGFHIGTSNMYKLVLP
ncbi:hypothetical protein Pelo_8643 [Pelomyxa schiedti]|nr:hypothetical protein Pelo_8643 [Pelomyxa schiedti]